MFKKIWRIWTIVGFFVIIAFFAYKLSNQKSCSYYYKNEKKKFYSGIITNKYVDKKEHNNKFIELENEYNNLKLLMNNDLSGLFEYVRVNDSIIKKKDSYLISVYRNSKKDTIFELDYGCK